MKVVFVTSEIAPFSKTGGLADVSGALPIALEKLGLEILIISPKYKSCKYKDAYIGKHIKVHFVQEDDFFDRDNLYGDKFGDYDDNLDRFSFFSRAVLEYLKEKGFSPNVIHCNDWQTSLIPIYLKTLFKSEDIFKHTNTLLTIHNIAYQGIFEDSRYEKMGIGREFFNTECLEFYGKINLLKGGIVFSHGVNTVSPTHAKEIQTPEFGYGLDGVLRRYKNKLHGILNGIDYSQWDPKVNGKIKKNYSIENIEDKYVNKEDLQGCCDLKVGREIPLFGTVSRLAEQKGIEILAGALDDIVKEEAQFIFLGTGDAPYHRMLEDLKDKYPKQVSINLCFDPVLAQKIYAGCDMFLMPSKYEPCGLGQMISLRYGTIPIVRKTGGLADTIEEFDFKHLVGSGFVFLGYDKKEFMKAIRRAIGVYKEKKFWSQLIKHAMSYDFSWEHSAKEYLKLYKKLSKL